MAAGVYAAMERGDDDEAASTPSTTPSTTQATTPAASVIPAVTAPASVTTIASGQPPAPSPTIPLPSLSLPSVTLPTISLPSTTASATAAATTLTPGAPLPDGEPPDDLGGDAILDAVAADCYQGDMDACDDLYLSAASGSPYRAYGDTCAGRQPELTGLLCVDAFPGAPPTTTG